MGGKGRGTAPLAAERIIEELKNPKLDWRTILNDFVQEEICDYSFAPPDKRMEDCPFFLPDFNEKDESAKNLLFMIDTSGSMSDDAITECYSEIYGAIQQFNGKLQGKLGFFDAVVVEPTPFEDEDEFKIIRPKGGGGTSFHVIFEYVKEEMQDNPPVSIIILTDGYAPFPKIEDTQDIPVLWIINNNDVTPPWGKIARMIQE
jgi:predicted metal-dependent peptidase